MPYRVTLYDWLQGAVEGGEHMSPSEIKITVAAILLFGKAPTQFLPGARLRFLRYEGVTAEVGTRFNLVKDVTIERPLHPL